MAVTSLSNIISHIREHSYMSGVERDNLRIKQTAEVFTPTPLVQEMLDTLPPEVFTDTTKTFLDNSCGDCQFLSEVVIRKMESGSCSLEQALSTTYGIDIMLDNVELCKKRLAGPDPSPEILTILERNIVCADGLTYHYRFDGTPPDMSEGELHASEFFDF
jgi:hypothetical protein